MNPVRFEIFNFGERSIREGIDGVIGYLDEYTPFGTEEEYVKHELSVLKVTESLLISDDDVVVTRIK